MHLVRHRFPMTAYIPRAPPSEDFDQIVTKSKYTWRGRQPWEGWAPRTRLVDQSGLYHAYRLRPTSRFSRTAFAFHSSVIAVPCRVPLANSHSCGISQTPMLSLRRFLPYPL